MGIGIKSIKEVLPETLYLSKKAMELYFRLTYIPSPYSIYENVYKLLPNYYLEVDIKSLEYHEIIIDNLKQEKANLNISFNEAKLKTKALVTKSVISRSVSDVTIGTFLSGGVDSSIVSLC